MFLCSSHIGVIYNFEKNEQYLLQGHVRTSFSFMFSNFESLVKIDFINRETVFLVWSLVMINVGL